MPERVTPPARSSEVRRSNEKQILRLLYEERSLSQSDIVERTGLQASTVFRIFTALEDRGLIRAGGYGEHRSDKRGRKPAMYELDPGSRTVIGAELSRTGLSVTAVDFSGAVLHHETTPLTGTADAEAAVADLIRSIDRVMKASRIEASSCIGIGVGVPGVVDTELGTVINYERFTGMNGFPIAELIRTRIGVPVSVHNNASIIALSEYRLGRARGTRSTAAFLLRAGMGGAYINDGRIVESHGRSAFEIGHLFSDLSTFAVDTDEQPHVLELLLSEQSILEHVRSRTESEIGWTKLIRLLREQDESIQDALRPRANLLAAVARNVALLVSPESFLVVTRFQELSEFFAETVRTYFARVTDPVRLGVNKIIPIAYNSLNAARGGAELVFQRYFSDTLDDI